MAVRHPYLIRPRSTDSALRLCALSRMCIALYRKSFVDGGLQGVSAVQAACVRQSNELFQAMEQHIRHSSRIDEQCRLLSELHSLTGETDYVVNPRKQEAWDMCAGEVLDRFFSLSAPVAPATEAAVPGGCSSKTRCLPGLPPSVTQRGGGMHFRWPMPSNGWNCSTAIRTCTSTVHTTTCCAVPVVSTQTWH